jgi:hypothetical protein
MPAAAPIERDGRVVDVPLGHHGEGNTAGPTFTLTALGWS